MGKEPRNKKAPATGGGLMRRMRQGARKVTGQGKDKQQKLSFWDILFWIVAAGAVLALVYRRFS